MKYDLPQKYNNGFFSRIKRLFFVLFGIFNDTIDKIANNNEKKSVDTSKIEFQKNPIALMREQYIKNREKEKLLMQIEENPDIINGWSIDNLKKLEAIYDEIIQKYNDELASFKENT